MEAGKIAYRCKCGREVEDAKPGETVTCPGCGIRFVVEDGCSKFKILPEIGEDEFVRAAWVHLAKMDVPLDVFERDLGDVETVERRVVIDTQKVDVSYKAVTSFSENASVQGECVANSSVCVDSGKEELVKIFAGDYGAGLGAGEEVGQVSFSGEAFLKSLGGMSATSFVPPYDNECEDMEFTQECEDEADKRHGENIDGAVKEALDGVEYRYLEHDDVVAERSTQIFLVPEYRASIAYRGKTYTVSAYPFGDEEVYGGEIESKAAARAFEREKRARLAAEEKDVRRGSAEEMRRRNGPLSIAAVTLCSLFVLGAIAFSILFAFVFMVTRSTIMPLIISSMIILGSILIVAIVISSVNAVRAYRIVKRTGSGSSDLLHSKDRTWKKNKAYTIAALVLWGALCVGMIVYMPLCVELYPYGWHNFENSVAICCLSVLAPLLFAAIVVSVANAVRANKIGKKIEDTVSGLLLPKEESVEAEIEAYEKRHSGELLDALNEKLSSLGMDPVVAADLERTDLEN